MKTLLHFLSESFDTSNILKRDELTTTMARAFRSDLSDVHVYNADVGDEKIQVTHFKKDGVRELHFTNFTSGMPSVDTPVAGTHSRKAIKLYAAMYHLMKPHFEAGEPIKIQSADQEMHSRHMGLISSILQRKMPGQFEIKHVGNKESSGFQGGSFPTSLITKKYG